jgi:uncharacterized protein DUF2490
VYTARSASSTDSHGLASTGRRSLRLAWLAFLVLLRVTGAALADEPSKEFWPEVDLWLRLSPTWRLSMFIPISKNIETAYREGNLILQADYAWGKKNRLRPARLLDENRAQAMNAMLVRGGYLGGRSLDDQGQAYQEHTMFIELHVRTPLKQRVLVSHRLRTDLRWLGDDSDFSTRWRYRLMVEKEVEAGSSSLVPYVNVEAYYDSRYATVNRVRLIGGTSVAWSPRYALEGNLTYQHDSQSSVTELYALNLILHVFFEAGRRPSARPSGLQERLQHGRWRGRRCCEGISTAS